MIDIRQGDALVELRKIRSESVQCCVTSPPYWGLRDYGVSGQIGLEDSLDEFLLKLVDVFSEVHRVLKKSGTCWINMGDCYAGGGNGGGGSFANDGIRAPRPGSDKNVPSRTGARGAVGGLKPKDLIGQPWLLAFALRGSAVISCSTLREWADTLRAAREAGDWSLVAMIEGRLRMMDFTDALKSAGWFLRSDIIWFKPNAMPESVKDRPTKAHEYLFLLTKSQRYFYDATAIKEIVTGTAHPRGAGVNPKANTVVVNGWMHGPGSHDVLAHAKPGGSYKGSVPGRKDVPPGQRKTSTQPRQNASFSSAVHGLVEIRNKRSVWTVPTFPCKEAHFATYPPDLIRPCILAGTKPGDMVLDPFAGTGTTAEVAVELGRRATVIELNPASVRLIEKRTHVTFGLPLVFEKKRKRVPKVVQVEMDAVTN